MALNTDLRMLLKKYKIVGYKRYPKKWVRLFYPHLNMCRLCNYYSVSVVCESVRPYFCRKINLDDKLFDKDKHYVYVVKEV